MEFERALYRVHQRALHSEAFRRVRLHAERVLPWTVAGLAASLALLHVAYVGRCRCLPQALQQAGLWNTTSGEAQLPEDATLLLLAVPGDGDEEPARSPGTGAGSTPDPESVAAVYRFAFDRELITMRPTVFQSHQFKSHNISLPVNCLVPSGPLRLLFQSLNGFDGLIVNELAYTFRARGFLQRLASTSAGSPELEVWAWSARQVKTASPGGIRSLVAWVVTRKLLVLLRAMITFAFVSATTGFFIRVAVNGSAVLMFVVALLSRALGSNSGRMSMRVLTRSFPWIGVHVDVLNSAGRPIWPLLRAHLAFLGVQSFAYLSCSLAWRVVLYRRMSPEGFEEQVFSFCSVLELFNLLFVRTLGSAAIFPKLASASMIYLHFYVFCSLYPFHMLSLATCAAACLYVMAYCLNHFEEPALRADPFAHETPTAAHPRALYHLQLSPSWSLETAPLWTMFLLPEAPASFPEEAMRHISDEEYMMP